MDMQLIREDLRLEQPLGTGHASAVVTGDVTLPGGLREETRVLAAMADVAVERAEPAQGRVNVRGRVVFRVLYTQGDPSKVNAVEASADFVQPCDLPGCQARATAEGRARTERVEARANGGRLSLRAEIALDVSAVSLLPVDAITCVEGADDVQVRTGTQTIWRTAATGEADVLLREELPLPDGLQIRETLFAMAYPVAGEVTGGVGRVGLNGQVLLEAVHLSALAERPIVVTRHTIPFSQSVAITGEEGEQISGAVSVRDVAVASQADGEGMTMRAEVLLGLSGRADVQETLSILEDAYTTCGDDVRLTCRQLQCRTGGGRVSAAETGKATLRLPDSAPPVRTVLAAFVQPQLNGTECHSGRTILSGALDTTLLYMTDDSDAPVSMHLSEPFRAAFAVETPPDALLSLAATEAEAVPVTSDRLELRCVLHLEATCEASQTITLATEGQVIPDQPLTEDMVLCFVQAGETLWDVARRYRTPVQSVRALNPELQGEPVTGQGVIVWRRPQTAG